jgi:hypothetical protein
MLVIPALGSDRQNHCEFKASLGYIARLHRKKKKKKKDKKKRTEIFQMDFKKYY